MTPIPAHWHPSIHHAATMSDDEKKQLIRSDRWVGYPAVEGILAELEDLLRHPKRLRMPCLLIVGEAFSGKSTVLDYFAAQHPPFESPEEDRVVIPALLIQAPPTPDEGAFFDIILERLFAAHKINDRIGKKRFQTIQLLKRVGLRMLLIDEIHHTLAGSMNRQRGFLNLLKYLANELQIPLVCAGTIEANRAIDTDAQLTSRFARARLERWIANNDARKLLASIETLLPLPEPSKLSRQATTDLLIEKSEGVLGWLCTLVERSAIKAIELGRSHIDEEVIKSVPWVRPSKIRLEGERPGL